MNFEPGKFYRTRDGRKAVIYAVYPDQDKENIHGGLYVDDKWCISFSWEKNGTLGSEPSGNDLVAPWSDYPQVSIPWDKISDDLIFVAMDEDGTWCAYGAKPGLGSTQWHVPSYLRSPYYALPPEFCPKGFTGNWKDSLFERPD
jgi:hypothetical protein